VACFVSARAFQENHGFHVTFFSPARERKSERMFVTALYHFVWFYSSQNVLMARLRD